MTRELWPWSRRARGNDDLQCQLNPRQGAFGVAMQKSIVTHAPKALGKDVLQEEPEKILAKQCSPSRLTGGAFGVGEGHTTVAVVDDAALADDAAVEVTRQVLQCGLAFADMPAVDDPGRGDVVGDRQAGAVEAIEQPSAKDPRERLGVEKVAPSLSPPLLPRAIEAASRDHYMAVGMKVEIPRMGVEHQGQSDVTAETSGIEPEVSKCARDRMAKQTVDGLLVTPGQLPQFAGQREGDHEVLDGQELGLLPIEPLARLEVLTLRAIAVATGLMPNRFASAVRALQSDVSGVGCPATEHGIEGVAMTGQQAVTMACFEAGSIATNDRSKTDHHSRSRSTRKPLTNVFITSAVCCVVS